MNSHLCGVQIKKYYLFIYMTDLLERELLARQLQMEISRNNASLISGLHQMERMRHNNTFLEDVYNDYKRYHNYILLEKQKQKLQMEFILEYLENSIEGKELSEEMLTRAKFERKNILRSLNSIRDDLNELVVKGRDLVEKCEKKK